MVWICSTCGKKNNNNAKKCIKTKGCNTQKSLTIEKKKVENQKKNYIRDYCPVCNIHRNFKRIKGNQWACQGCHKKFKFKGKPVPEPKTDTHIKEDLDIELRES